MVTRTTRWRPDTCSCVIDFSWDDSTDVEKREHKLSDVVEKCARHSGLSNKECYNLVIKENRAKNKRD